MESDKKRGRYWTAKEDVHIHSPELDTWSLDK